LKKISLILVVFFVLSFVSCGGDTKRPKSDDEANNDIEQTDDNSVNDDSNDNETPDDTNDESQDKIQNDEDTSGSVCGNNITEAGEECDGNVVDCIEVDSQKYTGGKTRCKKDCSGFDDITCDMADDYCGDGNVVFPEVCDGGSVTCTSIDNTLYSSGDADCKDDCTGYDVSECKVIEAVCGDGKIEGSEVCEKDDLKDCVDIDSSTYGGGKARCEKDCTGWDLITCEEKSGVLFSEGFESGVSAWELDGDFQVGVPNYDINGVEITVAKSGTSVLATILDGNYSDSLQSHAFTKNKVDIPGPNYVLKFWAYVNTDLDEDETSGTNTYYDGMTFLYRYGDESPTGLPIVAQSSDLYGSFKAYEGQSYLDLYGLRGTSVNNNYTLFTVDLFSLAGSSVYIGFKFYSDSMQGGDGSFPGIYIDDIEIVEE